MKIDQLQTPCYVIDEKKMRENLEILKKVQEDTGCKILLEMGKENHVFSPAYRTEDI